MRRFASLGQITDEPANRVQRPRPVQPDRGDLQTGGTHQGQCLGAKTPSATITPESFDSIRLLPVRRLLLIE